MQTVYVHDSASGEHLGNVPLDMDRWNAPAEFTSACGRQKLRFEPSCTMSILHFGPAAGPNGQNAGEFFSIAVDHQGGVPIAWVNSVLQMMLAESPFFEKVAEMDKRPRVRREDVIGRSRPAAADPVKPVTIEQVTAAERAFVLLDLILPHVVAGKTVPAALLSEASALTQRGHEKGWLATPPVDSPRAARA